MWLHPVICEVFWFDMMQMDGCVQYFEHLNFACPIKMFFTLTSVSRSLWHMVTADANRMSYLCEFVQRKFLMTAPRGFALQMIRADVLTRIMISKIASISQAANVDVIVGGGFAAWRLECAIDSHFGGDGLSRGHRTVSVSDLRDVNAVWTPRDIDLYVNGTITDTLVDRIIEHAFIPFFARMFGVVCASECVVLAGTVVIDADTGDDDKSDAVTSFSRMLRRCSLPHLLHERVVSAYKSSQHALQTHTISGAAMQSTAWLGQGRVTFPLHPCKLRIVSCAKQPSSAFLSWLTQTMLLQHRRVFLEVRENRYEYYCTKQTIDALMSRRLVFSPTNRPLDMFDMLGVTRYMHYGFSVLGDQHHEMSDREEVQRNLPITNIDLSQSYGQAVGDCGKNAHQY